MSDEEEKGERLTLGSAKKGARQQRLRLALRENLRRRKLQARARSDAPIKDSPKDGGKN
jgi:hypothetical protein